MRSKIVELLYEWSKVPYQKWFKQQESWDLTVAQLLQYPKISLGFHLGSFLEQHHFIPQPKLENHDVFHVLTNTGITVPDEIAMQYYLLGNGKKSTYLFMVIIIGTFIYLDKMKLFTTSFLKGRKAFSFYQLDYRKLLHEPLQNLQNTFSISPL